MDQRSKRLNILNPVVCHGVSSSLDCHIAAYLSVASQRGLSGRKRKICTESLLSTRVQTLSARRENATHSILNAINELAKKVRERVPTPSPSVSCAVYTNRVRHPDRTHRSESTNGKSRTIPKHHERPSLTKRVAQRTSYLRSTHSRKWRRRGLFGHVYDASAQNQLDAMRKLNDESDDNEFLARLAAYSRERAYMEDIAAALLAVLSTRVTKLMHQVFDRVEDNGRVSRTVFQMTRSGQFVCKGLPSSQQGAFSRWLNHASVAKLRPARIGNAPNLQYGLPCLV